MQKCLLQYESVILKSHMILSFFFCLPYWEQSQNFNLVGPFSVLAMENF